MNNYGNVVSRKFEEGIKKTAGTNSGFSLQDLSGCFSKGFGVKGFSSVMVFRQDLTGQKYIHFQFFDHEETRNFRS